MDPPGNYITICDAFTKRDERPYQVMGVVTDYLPPTRSRGPDFTMKVSIWDNSCMEVASLSREGMTFRFFHKDPTKLPPFSKPGDVILLRNVKTKSLGSSWCGLTNVSTNWIVLSGSDLLQSDCEAISDVKYHAYGEGSTFRPSAVSPSHGLDELRYAKELIRMKDPATLVGPPAHIANLDLLGNNTVSSSPREQKYRMLKDLAPQSGPSSWVFADLFGEVRKIYDSGSNVIELGITDYTENALLFNYAFEDGRVGDEYGYIENKSQWSGPWGRMTIVVSLWDEHATFIRDAVRREELAQGSYVLMQNIHIRMDRNGTYLQGHCRGGGRGGLTVYRPREAEGDQRFLGLLQRRREYDRYAKQNGLLFDRPRADQKKRKAVLEFDGDLNKPKTLSRNQKRMQKLQNKQKRAGGPLKQAEQHTTVGDNDQSNDIHKKCELNEHVRCEGINIQLTPIADIFRQSILSRKTSGGNSFTLPFQNCKYRSKLQVYDFFPHNLQDFTIPYKLSDYEALSDYDSENDSVAPLSYARKNPANVRWFWHFYLLVGHPQMKQYQENQPLMLLQVADQDGDYFLNAEACDLRKNPDELARLKEKLFVLWGELEETKQDRGKSGEELFAEGVKISSRPFECLIKEYGVNARDEQGNKIQGQYERMFQLFGTRIC